MSSLDRRSVRVHQPMFLLHEVLLAEGLLAGALLVVEGEMVLAVSGLLEKKGMILLGSETLEEEEALMFSGASLVIWYSWNLSSSVDWTGGIGRRTSGLCRCTGMLIQ